MCAISGLNAFIGFPGHIPTLLAQTEICQVLQAHLHLRVQLRQLLKHFVLLAASNFMIL